MVFMLRGNKNMRLHRYGCVCDTCSTQMIRYAEYRIGLLRRIKLHLRAGEDPNALPELADFFSDSFFPSFFATRFHHVLVAENRTNLVPIIGICPFKPFN
jgi:hypothetical protein